MNAQWPDRGRGTLRLWLVTFASHYAQRKQTSMHGSNFYRGFHGAQLRDRVLQT